MVPFNKSNSLIICGHWLSQDEKQNDPWAESIKERAKILYFASKLEWFNQYWCDKEKSNWQKLHYINNIFTWAYVFEIHFDVRWEKSNQGTKILYAWQTSEKEILNWEKNLSFANEISQNLDWKIVNSWGLNLLNSSKKPTVIMEVWDPQLPNFEETQKKVLDFLNNL